MHKNIDNRFSTPLNRLILALVVMMLLVSIGTLGFVLTDDLNFFEALYMTLATISTLGMKFREIEFSQAGKLWVMVLIVVGVAAAMIALSTIVSMVVEGHMRRILGRRKLNQKIASLHRHVIVCGYGLMGQSICEELRQRDTEIVVIDQDANQTVLAEQNKILYILGDATDEQNLLDAGIERARAMVAVLDSDASNVFATLVARDLNRNLFIVARAERVESRSRLIRAGANQATCPQEIGARRLANILTRPGLVEFIDFAIQGLELEAEQVVLHAESRLVGQTLREANLPSKAGVLVIALKRQNGETVFNPGPDVILNAGDKMIVTGRAGSIARLEELSAQS